MQVKLIRWPVLVAAALGAAGLARDPMAGVAILASGLVLVLAISGSRDLAGFGGRVSPPRDERPAPSDRDRTGACRARQKASG